MPLYEYHCTACGSDFEHLTRRAAEPDPRCGCGSERVVRIPYSRVSVAVAPSPSGGGGCGEEMGGCCGGGACQMN